MAQEEKAKAHDGNYKAYTELINRLEDVKNAIKKQNYGIAMDILYKHYPEFQITTSTELKESDRVRKEIQSVIEQLDKDSTICGKKYDYNRWLAWLEKQGEQKSIDDLTQQEAMDIAVAKCFEEGEQNPTGKVEPKFHKDDWIIHHGTENIYQVVAIIDNQYQLKYGDNYTIQNCADVDRCARLWDITKDAKDGDVLYMNNGAADSVFINKSIDNGIIYKYASYNKFGFEGEHYLVLNDGYVIPATKEQRDTLMKAMADAGFTFDFEKKELKKIFQRMISAEAKEALYDKLAWSEEDEETLDRIISNYHYFCNELSFKEGLTEVEKEVINNVDKEDIDWLKSLKDRVQPQLKQESDERNRLLGKLEKWLDEYVSNLADVDTATLICSFTNYLDGKLPKSLRPQNTWKPSDEQMERLKGIINSLPHQEVLYSLYKDLKKLKGE